MKTSRAFLVFSIFMFFYNCAAAQLFKLTNDLENVIDTAWINSATIISGDAFSGTKFSRTDSVNNYGFGYRAEFPADVQNKNLKIRFNERLRTSMDGKEFGMVASIAFGDSVIFYKFFNESTGIKLNDWALKENEITVPRTLTTAGYKLSIYFWNKDGATSVDIDDANIVFEEMSLPTFLPPKHVFKSNPEKFDQRIDIKNAVVWLNKKDGGMFIENLSEDSLMTSISMVTETIKKSKSDVIWENEWTQVNDSAALANGIATLSISNDISHSVLKINGGIAGRITFSLITVFDKPVSISRHALVLGYNWELKNVFKNTLTQTSNFNNEYWLGKEGFTMSNETNQMIVYKPAVISSIQLNVTDRQMIFNADYAGDHPMLHFPLLEKSAGKYEDYSPSVYKAKDTLRSEFAFFIVTKKTIVPTLLPSSNGYPATFVWTEHADYTSLRTNRAVYFGSENILVPDASTGGFIRYSIPVTKSIFYSNPKPVDNADKAGFLKGPEATLKETDKYRNFLKGLDESGIEICLHTPDHYTSDRKMLDEALSDMRREFFSVTWIDHGYDNAKTSNREDLNCDGAIQTSPYFAADLWEKYGIKYLWNSFYEDSAMYAPYSYNSFFTTPYAGFNDPMPMPVYWRHSTRTGDLIHWRTNNTLDNPDGSLWSYLFDDMRLNDMVNNRTTAIIHCYPARVDSTTGFYDINGDVISANEGFNDALKKLSRYRAEGKIRLSTVKEMLEFRTSLEDISYEFPGNGIVHLQNNGKANISGVTFAAHANELKSSKKNTKQKRVGDELIFWLDFAAGETIDLLLK